MPVYRRGDQNLVSQFRNRRIFRVGYCDDYGAAVACRLGEGQRAGGIGLTLRQIITSSPVSLRTWLAMLDGSTPRTSQLSKASEDTYPA